jgi:hypothetical protein
MDAELKQSIADILVEHCYMVQPKQCRCQVQEVSKDGTYGRPKDWDGMGVYGVYSWAEHVTDLIEEKLKTRL